MNDTGLCAELLALCAKWDFPLGPFLTEDDVHREMGEFAEKIGSCGASDLAKCLKQQGRTTFRHTQPLSDFAENYQKRYPQLVQHLLQLLESSGPPLLVELLGASKRDGVTEKLIETIGPEPAGTALQIAFFGALGELRDSAAIGFLGSVAEDDYDEEVRSEIAIAKRNASVPSENHATLWRHDR